ncbi:MAG: hypothetical protein JWR16_1298 [Nevskia sp.]|nr:hypothetical protein [Nevskia sp.]
MVITPLYAGLLALWFFVLSLRVVQGRTGKAGVSLGDGGDTSMLRRIRGHANFAEYVPLILILLGLLELSHFSAWVLHALGLTLLIARLLHGYAFSFTAYSSFGRSAGAGLTFVVLLVAGVLCTYQGVMAYLLLHSAAA